MLDDKGLTEADYVLRDELIDELDATSHEKKSYHEHARSVA